MGGRRIASSTPNAPPASASGAKMRPSHVAAACTSPRDATIGVATATPAAITLNARRAKRSCVP